MDGESWISICQRKKREGRPRESGPYWVLLLAVVVVVVLSRVDSIWGRFPRKEKRNMVVGVIKGEKRRVPWLWGVSLWSDLFLSLWKSEIHPGTVLCIRVGGLDTFGTLRNGGFRRIRYHYCGNQRKEDQTLWYVQSKTTFIILNPPRRTENIVEIPIYIYLLASEF